MSDNPVNTMNIFVISYEKKLDILLKIKPAKELNAPDHQQVVYQ